MMWIEEVGGGERAHKLKLLIVLNSFLQGQDITDEKAVLYYQAIHGMVDKVSFVLIGCILIGTALIISALVITSIVSISVLLISIFKLSV